MKQRKREGREENYIPNQRYNIKSRSPFTQRPSSAVPRRRHHQRSQEKLCGLAEGVQYPCGPDDKPPADRSSQNSVHPPAIRM